MGQVAALTKNDRAVRSFAQRLRNVLGVEQALLYGDHVTSWATPESDYCLILVSRQFEGIDLLDRPIGLHDHFYAVGGNAPLDLTCLTPADFERAKEMATIVRQVLPEAIDLLAEEPAPA
jgi:uncharacterized protein